MSCDRYQTRGGIAVHRDVRELPYPGGTDALARTLDRRRGVLLSSICGPQTLSRSTRPLASTTWPLFFSASSPLAVFSLPCTCSAALASR